jgi:hypothetical protein
MLHLHISLVSSSNAMQEILGGTFRASATGSTKLKLGHSEHSSPSRSHSHSRKESERGVSRDRKALTAEDVRLSTVRESMVLREHETMVHIHPERTGAHTSATGVDHGTLYKQHFSGLEVLFSFSWMDVSSFAT